MNIKMRATAIIPTRFILLLIYMIFFISILQSRVRCKEIKKLMLTFSISLKKSNVLAGLPLDHEEDEFYQRDLQ